MKKILFLTAVFTAALSSCSQDATVEMNNGKGISFRAFTDLPTRSTDVTTSSLSGFHIWALQGQGQGLTSATVAWEDDYSVADGNATSDKGNVHYWPGEGSTLFFYAYNKEAIDADGSKVCGGTVNIATGTHAIEDVTPAATAKEQKDLVVAYQSGNKKTPGTSAVNLNFVHAFTKVSVQAKHNVGNLKLKVLGVRIYGVNNKATLTLPEKVTSSREVLATSAWSPNVNTDANSTAYKYSSIAELDADGTNAVEITSASNSTPTSIMLDNGNAFMLLPQTLTAWDKTGSVTGAYIAVLCQATQTYGDGGDSYQLFPAGEANKGKYAWTAVPVSGSWEPGKAYNYVLDFSNGGGTIPPKDEDDNSKEPIVPPTDPTKPGDDAWGGAITFTVSVTDWAAVSEVPAPMTQKP